MASPFDSFNPDTFARVADTIAGIFRAKSEGDASVARARADAEIQTTAIKAGLPAPGTGFNLSGLVPLVVVAVVGSILVRMIGRR